MTDFRERAQRISADFALVFAAEGKEVSGRCVNISASGLLGVFAEELDLWTVGEVTLLFGEGVLGIKARVARAVDQQTGLVFLSETGEERDRIALAVESARVSMGSRRQQAAPF